MSLVRHVSPLPTVRDRPGSCPSLCPGHGWSQKVPCITKAPFVQSTEPAHRHSRDKHETVLLSWTALSRDKLSIATLARHGRPSRSLGTSSSTIKRIPSARASGFDDSIRCTSVMKHDSRTRLIWFAFSGNLIKTRKKNRPVNKDPKNS